MTNHVFLEFLCVSFIVLALVVVPAFQASLPLLKETLCHEHVRYEIQCFESDLHQIAPCQLKSFVLSQMFQLFAHKDYLICTRYGQDLAAMKNFPNGHTFKSATDGLTLLDLARLASVYQEHFAMRYLWLRCVAKKHPFTVDYLLFHEHLHQCWTSSIAVSPFTKDCIQAANASSVEACLYLNQEPKPELPPRQTYMESLESDPTTQGCAKEDL